MKRAAISGQAERRPMTIVDWRNCLNRLQAQQTAQAQERADLGDLYQSLALAAATGDARAAKRVDELKRREQALDREAETLAIGAKQVAVEMAVAEAAKRAESRGAAIAQQRARLAGRLNLIAEAEQHLFDAAGLLMRLGKVTEEIVAAHATLGGTQSPLPPLAAEVVGGRMAEFMAGAGFEGWLPLARPEIRPAIRSWREVECEAQRAYDLTS